MSDSYAALTVMASDDLPPTGSHIARQYRALLPSGTLLL
jgi:hypothetical protein